MYPVVLYVPVGQLECGEPCIHRIISNQSAVINILLVQLVQSGESYGTKINFKIGNLQVALCKKEGLQLAA